MPSGNARVQCSRPRPGAMATLVQKCSAWTCKCSQNTLEPVAPNMNYLFLGDALDIAPAGGDARCVLATRVNVRECRPVDLWRQQLN